MLQREGSNLLLIDKGCRCLRISQTSEPLLQLIENLDGGGATLERLMKQASPDHFLRILQLEVPLKGGRLLLQDRRLVALIWDHATPLTCSAWIASAGRGKI